MNSTETERAMCRRNRVHMMSSKDAYIGSDGADTRAFLKRLEQSCDEGHVAAQLFRCQKASARAKMYRGKYRGHAYNRKGDAIAVLTALLGTTPQLRWGWKADPVQHYAPWVLYVELPQGQVSFHSTRRGNGPDYLGEWDQQNASEHRILAYCDSLLLREHCPHSANQ